MNSETTTAQVRPQPELAPLHRDSIRIVALGDSLAYGAGDETGKGIVGRLKDDLRADRFENVQTVNLGVNGAETSDLIAKMKQPHVREEIGRADAIVLSIGANDLFRSPAAREQTMRAPLAVADRILTRVTGIVADIHALNPRARVLILGGYNPVPSHPLSPMINQYLQLWDATLANRFEEQPWVSIVRMSDIVTPQRLSRYDNFHPGGAAYALAAQRIASMLAEQAS